MNYPNGRKTAIAAEENTSDKLKVSASNRGMSLEDDINKTNIRYLKEDLAVVHKKPTPITIVKVDYPKRSAARIIEAYFKLPSTTDYNGIYKGRYLDFEAKECRSRTAFPLKSIHEHQIEHLRSVVRHGAIAFLIMRMSYYSVDYLIKAEDVIDYYDHTSRHSIAIGWIKEHGYPIDFKLTKPVDYLSVVAKIYKF